MARPKKKANVAHSNIAQEQPTVASKEQVVETAPVVNHEEEVEQKEQTQAKHDCAECNKSVADREDAIIGAVLKHHDGFKQIYAILGYNYHFQGFLQSLIWIAASELRKMNINIEPSTVIVRLKEGHKTTVDVAQMEAWENNAPSLGIAIKIAESLKNA